MITGSVTASASPSVMSSFRRASAALPVARSYSTQAEVSARSQRIPRSSALAMGTALTFAVSPP